MFFKIQKLDLLISLFIFCTLVAELMGSKTFHLAKIGNFDLNASVAIFVIPVIFLIDDIVTEVFGKLRARSIVYSSILMVALLSIFTLVATHLSPSGRFLPLEGAYDSIFNFSIRLSIASISAFLFAELMDIYVFSIIRQKYGKSNLWLRTNISNFISQFIDTSLFITIAFYSLKVSPVSNLLFLAGIILPYWLLKCSMSVIETPFVYLGVRWLQKGKNDSQAN